MNILAFFGLGTPEIIAILVIFFLIFGAKKLPELARGIGKSLGEFKKAKSEFEEELLKTEQEIKTDSPAKPKTQSLTHNESDSPQSEQNPR